MNNHLKKIIWFPAIAFIQLYLWLFGGITPPHLVTEARDLLSIYWGKK